MNLNAVRFAAALAVSLTAGAVICAAEMRGNIGSLGEWVSGLASALAAICALYIAENEARRARDVASATRIEAENSKRNDELRILKALLLVLLNGRDSVHSFLTDLQSDPADARGKAAAFLGSRIEAHVSACLNDLSIHQMPSTTAIDILMAARARWADTIDRINSLSGVDWPRHLIPVVNANTAGLDVVLSALADEIVRRGGEPSANDDQGVNQQIRLALQRAAV